MPHSSPRPYTRFPSGADMAGRPISLPAHPPPRTFYWPFYLWVCMTCRLAATSPPHTPVCIPLFFNIVFYFFSRFGVAHPVHSYPNFSLGSLPADNISRTSCTSQCHDANPICLVHTVPSTHCTDHCTSSLVLSHCRASRSALTLSTTSDIKLEYQLVALCIVSRLLCLSP